MYSLSNIERVLKLFLLVFLADAVMTTGRVSDEGEGVYVMEDTLVYLILSLLLCGLHRITALNQSEDSAKRPWENSPIPGRRI